MPSKLPRLSGSGRARQRRANAKSGAEPSAMLRAGATTTATPRRPTRAKTCSACNARASLGRK
eukprot:11217174-Lingulodinium_polyedra.AAC.1